MKTHIQRCLEILCKHARGQGNAMTCIDMGRRAKLPALTCSVHMSILCARYTPHVLRVKERRVVGTGISRRTWCYYVARNADVDKLLRGAVKPKEKERSVALDNLMKWLDGCTRQRA